MRGGALLRAVGGFFAGFLTLRALERKLLRDLWRLRGQVLAIGLVIASGVAVLVMSLGTIEALRETASAFYDRANFADVFASLERAPESLTRRIAEIPGVRSVETRIVRISRRARSGQR